MKNIAGTNVAIIGVDDLGLALAQSLHKRKANVTLSGRDYLQVSKQVSELKLPVAVQPMLNAVIDADVILLAAPDSQIGSLCNSLSINFKQGSVVAHFSSVLDSSDLESAHRKKGVHTCSLHPLNIYSGLEETMRIFGNRFHRTYLYGEGDKEALEITDTIFKELGFLPVEISRKAKPKYHAACVIARDYLTVLLQSSIDTAVSAGIDRNTFWLSLQPLVKATLLSISTKGAEQTLSGPITTGDIETLEKHLNILEDVSSSLPMTYADIGKQALSLIVKNSGMDRETILKIHSVLDQAINKGP